MSRKKKKKIDTAKQAAGFDINPFANLNIPKEKLKEDKKEIIPQKNEKYSDLSADEAQYMKDAGIDPDSGIIFDQTPNMRKPLRIHHTRRKRKGKTVTIVSGFIEIDEEHLINLLNEIKTKLGTGGIFRDNTLEIQGDQRERLKTFFEKKEYRVK
ncbi:MAG: translation initiation factor [Verrucomicrobiota bacterium]|nr:translation initiation factor [Verrucomicrobiota bacterium]